MIADNRFVIKKAKKSEQVNYFAYICRIKRLKIQDMKRLVALCMVVMFTCTAGIVNAQSGSIRSDKELSNQFKAEIDVLKSEIKTLKLKLKTEEDVTLRTELREKTEALNVVKDKKAVIDKAIKSQKASEKAAKKADKAQLKAEKAARAAKQVKEGEQQ
jgi:hypothetical protein